MRRHVRSMTGVLSIGLFSLIATASWPSQPLLAYVAGGLALLRLVVLVRQL